MRYRLYKVTIKDLSRYVLQDVLTNTRTNFCKELSFLCLPEFTHNMDKPLNPKFLLCEVNDPFDIVTNYPELFL